MAGSPPPFAAFEWMIAWRYLRARRAEGGVSVMTWISLLGITLAVYRAYRIIAKERVVALAAIAVLALISGSWDGVWLLVAVDVVIFAALVAEHLRIESGGD